MCAAACAILLTLVGCGSDPPPVADGGEFERFASNPVIEPGFGLYAGGPTVDSVSDPDVLYDESLEKWRMWFAVSYFEGEEFYTGIMHAESTDGLSWSVNSELALSHGTSSSAWDYTSTETPSVVIDPDADAAERYKLYYSGGNVNENPLGGYPRFQIGAAVSSDGYTYTRIPAAESPYGEAGLVFRVEDSMPAYADRVADGVIADPEVRLDAGTFQLWFTVIGLDGSDGDVAGGIGYATSSDGIQWLPDAANPIDSIKRFTDDFTAQPSALERSDGTYELWYNADLPSEQSGYQIGANATLGFWRATGTSPTSFSLPEERAFALDPDEDLEKWGLAVGVDVIRHNGQTRLYYGSLADTEATTFPGNPFDFTYVLSMAIPRGE